jgi:hypothetical protein
MTRHCIAYGCTNNSSKKGCAGLSWHSLPINNKGLLRTWLIKIKRENTPVTKNSYLCSTHFTADCFVRAPGGSRVYLKPGSIPTIFSFSQERPSRKAPLDRSDRSSVDTDKSLGQTSTNLADSEFNEAEEQNDIYSLPFEATDYPKEMLDEESQSMEQERTDICHEHSARIAELEESLQSMESKLKRTEELLERRIAELELQVKESERKIKEEREAREILEQKLLENVFSIDNIKNSDKLFKFYTGLQNYYVFCRLLDFLGREAASRLDYGNKDLERVDLNARPGPQRALSIENELFLLLCRCKVGLLEEDLATRFRIAQSLVSNIFITWAKFVFFRLKELNIFPDRDVLELHKPQCFKDKYKGTTVIIDATEIYIEKPSNPEAQQLTFSSYKNSNTLKALVGITPSGSVCFVSELYGGSISDKDITLKSGFIEKLQRDDEVMADRGFNIQELPEVLNKGVKVNVPPFMNESGQFTESELLKTRRIATLRIHVERAIERIKNYHILDFIPITLCKNGLIDMIFFICAMFTNFLPPLVN